MRDLSELDMGFFSRPEMPSPTEDQIAFVEGLIGAKLPASYIDFLLFSNGGKPAVPHYFYDRTEGSRYDWRVDLFFHISSDLDSLDNVVWNYQHWGAAPREVLPIAEDGLGNYVCLDLTEPGKDRVILWVHDDPDLPFLEVADSFEEFIDSLTSCPSDA